MKEIKTRNISTYIGVALFILGWISMFIVLIFDISITPEDSSGQSLIESLVSEESILSENESAIIESSEEVSEEELVIVTPLSEGYTVIESDVISELRPELDYCKKNLYLSQSVINYIKAIGYEDTCNLMQALLQDCENYQSYIDIYEKRIQELTDIKYTQGLGEYPIATYIWFYMKEQGWSDYVCAGIMGNIMQETGGRTLNIDYLYDGNGYYGMCCWKKQHHPEVVRLGLEGQCEYLVKTVSKVMDSHGYLYQEGYTFQDFLRAESVEEVAAAFMIVYERPEHTNPTKRVENGEQAYEYFVG